MTCSVIIVWKMRLGWEYPDCPIRSYRIGKVGRSQPKYGTNRNSVDIVGIGWYDS
jgi:hypothetical protein